MGGKSFTFDSLRLPFGGTIELKIRTSVASELTLFERRKIEDANWKRVTLLSMLSRLLFLERQSYEILSTTIDSSQGRISLDTLKTRFQLPSSTKSTSEKAEGREERGYYREYSP